MNKERRKQIDEACVLLDQAKQFAEQAQELIDQLRDEEQEYKDNMPESFQDGDKGQRADEAIDALQNAYDEISNFDFDCVFNYLDEAAQ